MKKSLILCTLACLIASSALEASNAGDWFKKHKKAVIGVGVGAGAAALGGAAVAGGGYRRRSQPTLSRELMKDNVIRTYYAVKQNRTPANKTAFLDAYAKLRDTYFNGDEVSTQTYIQSIIGDENKPNGFNPQIFIDMYFLGAKE